MARKSEKTEEKVKGIVCVTHYFEDDKLDSLVFISATYVDFLYKDGSSVRQSFLYKVDPKKTLAKSKKEVEDFLDNVYSFSKTKKALLFYSKDLPAKYSSKKGPKPQLSVRHVTKLEYLKNPSKYNSESDLINDKVIFFNTYVLNTGIVHALSMVYFDYSKGNKIKDEVITLSSKIGKDSDRKLEQFLGKWNEFAEKKHCLIYELEPVLLKSKKDKINPVILSHEEYLEMFNEDSAENEDAPELDPNSSGVVTLTPYFDDSEQLCLLSYVYVDFKNGKGNLMSASETLEINFEDDQMQQKINDFTNAAKDLAEKTDSAFIMIDNQKLEFCKKRDCNCGEVNLSFLNEESFLEIFEEKNATLPPSDEKKDGHWLN
jgi:hypothetical protein